MAQSTTMSKLDSEELLHLALRESENDQHEKAIELLKRALEIDPKNANIFYMLGAEHAQIGLYDRAAEEMQKAVALDPQLHTAHFQLGLLHLTSGRVSEAEIAWSPLDKLGERHPFYLFKTGMLKLANDDFHESCELIMKGMSLNDFNQPLNNDMQKVLDQIYSMHPDLKPTTDSSDLGTDSSRRAFLSAYKDGD